jgi:hypothetical protein
MKRRGGIGFMSTQKRVSRFTSAARISRSRETSRRRQPWNGTDRAGAWGSVSPALLPRNAHGGGITAPHLSIIWSIWFWMATNFLLEDKPIRLSVRPASQAELPGSPPFRSTVSGQPASPGHPAIPFPTSHVSLHPALPQAPANIRRAERYDGQRNLHFLHAA